MSYQETIRARVARCLEDAKANQTRVFEAVIVDGGGFISLAYVGKILRGADDQGEKADRIRVATAELTGKPVSFLFMEILPPPATPRDHE